MFVGHFKKRKWRHNKDKCVISKSQQGSSVIKDWYMFEENLQYSLMECYESIKLYDDCSVFHAEILAFRQAGKLQDNGIENKFTAILAVEMYSLLVKTLQGRN